MEVWQVTGIFKIVSMMLQTIPIMEQIPELHLLGYNCVELYTWDYYHYRISWLYSYRYLVYLYNNIDLLRFISNN